MSISLLDDILARIQELTPEARKELDQTIAQGTAGLRWIPNPGPQTMAYHSPADELYYGGQAGGGKSDLLLGLALNEHTVSRIFRRQHNDRQALIDRMSQILGTRDGYNGSDHVWRVPGTEKIVRFGALSDPNAWERYQGDPTDLKGWDEITQFRQHEYVTVNAWLRTTIKGQRTRIVAAGNPPLTPEALWVIEYWAPWLDPRHQNPAKDGELRWFTTIDGESVEVDADWRGVGPSGEEIKPKSRTFIRASVSDNPDMVEAGYSSTLANLPKHLREALLEGKFNASLEDDAWQVIPTEWVLAAQQRWEQRKHEERGPMTAVGVDPSGGGADRTVLVPCWGNYIGEPVIEQGLDLKNPRVIAAAIIKVTKDNPQLNIDCTGGWGAGPAEHLESNGFEVVRCIFSAGSTQRSRCRLFGFANKRAEYYWQAREVLDPDSGDDVCLPPGRRVIAELTAARYSLRNRKDILIEPKEDVKARLGESPDIGDAIVLALAETGATRRTRTTKGMDGKAFANVTTGPKINLSYGRSSVAPIKKKGW